MTKALKKNPQKIVYLVRHGQSVDNTSPVFQSSASPLSETGKKQAEQLANRASHLDFECLISSPLPRAKQTAEIIARQTDTLVELSDLFAERIKPAPIDGKAYDNTNASRVWRDWEKSLYTPGMKVADGENFDEITQRASRALNYLLGREENSILVVSHGFFLRTIVAKVLLADRLEGEDLKEIIKATSMENTAITVLHYRDDFEEDFRWRLWTHNDHAHFAE